MSPTRRDHPLKFDCSTLLIVAYTVSTPLVCLRQKRCPCAAVWQSIRFYFPRQILRCNAPPCPFLATHTHTLQSCRAPERAVAPVTQRYSVLNHNQSLDPDNLVKQPALGVTGLLLPCHKRYLYLVFCIFWREKKNQHVWEKKNNEKKNLCKCCMKIWLFLFTVKYFSNALILILLVVL